MCEHWSVEQWLEETQGPNALEHGWRLVNEYVHPETGNRALIVADFEDDINIINPGGDLNPTWIRTTNHDEQLRIAEREMEFDGFVLACLYHPQAEVDGREELESHINDADCLPAPTPSVA
jgi:hypothetical protein